MNLSYESWHNVVTTMYDVQNILDLHYELQYVLYPFHIIYGIIYKSRETILPHDIKWKYIYFK